MTTGTGVSSASPPARGTPPDPPPLRPQRPLPFDCCESGCARCVFDIYDEELASYESALVAWRARNPRRDPGAD
ncbi:MAG: oxidoreductase-like domain-containing protein [Lysobacter sp.]